MIASVKQNATFVSIDKIVAVDRRCEAGGEVPSSMHFYRQEGLGNGKKAGQVVLRGEGGLH